MDQLGKIRQHHWKARLQISKTTKFESDLLKTNEGMAPNSHKISQTFEWWGHKLAPQHTKACEFSQLCEAIIP